MVPIAIAFTGCNDRGHLVTPIFLLMGHFPIYFLHLLKRIRIIFLAFVQIAEFIIQQIVTLSQYGHDSLNICNSR